MGKNGYISEVMNGGRIVSHGEIEDLSEDFSLPNGALFTIYVRPKVSVDYSDVLLEVKCQQDEEFSVAPVVIGDWSPLLIRSIKADSALLESYRIFWGSGEYISVN